MRGTRGEGPVNCKKQINEAQLYTSEARFAGNLPGMEGDFQFGKCVSRIEGLRLLSGEGKLEKMSLWAIDGLRSMSTSLVPTLFDSLYNLMRSSRPMQV